MVTLSHRGNLVGAIFGVDVFATLFCVFGWLNGGLVVDDPIDFAKQTTNGHTSIVTVVVVWAYSIGVTILIAIVYYLLNQVQWLNNLGRKNRSHKDTKLENLVGYLSKLAIEHETGVDGKDRYQLASVRAEEEEIE